MKEVLGFLGLVATLVVVVLVTGYAIAAYLDCLYFPTWRHPTGGVFGVFNAFCDR